MHQFFFAKKMGKKWNENPKNDPDEEFPFRRGHVVVKFPLKSGLCTKKKGQKFSAAFGGRGIFLTSTKFLKVDFLRHGTLKILPHSKIRQILPSVDETYCRTTGNGANPTAYTQQNCHNCTAIAKTLGARDATRAELNSEGTMSLQDMQSVHHALV